MLGWILHNFSLVLHLVQKCFHNDWPSLTWSGHLCDPVLILKQPKHRFGSVVMRSLLLALEIHGQLVRVCAVTGLVFATQKSHFFTLAGGRSPVLTPPERPASGHLRRLYFPPRPPPPPRPPVPSAPTPAVAAAPERMSALLKRGFFGSLCLFTGPSVLDMSSYCLNLFSI